MKIFGIASMLLFVLCFLPQIVKTVKTRDVSGLSLGLWIMVVTGYLTGLIYVCSVRDGVLIATYFAGLWLSVIELGLIFFYKKS